MTEYSGKSGQMPQGQTGRPAAQVRSDAEAGSGRTYYQTVSELVHELRPSLPPARHNPSEWDWRKIKRIVVRVAIGLGLLAAATYVGDYAVARYRTERGSGLGSVTVVRLDAIPQKSGKTEFAEDGVEARTCLHSLFPHFGYAPCWYVNRHRDQRIQF